MLYLSAVSEDRTIFMKNVVRASVAKRAVVRPRRGFNRLKRAGGIVIHTLM